MAATPKRRGKKNEPEISPGKSSGQLVPQKHGGAIRRGNPGNAGGTGRPPSEIRAAMRKALDQRIHIAEKIAEDPESTPTERLKALDLLAKYGLGTKTEVTGEDGAPLQAGVVILPAVRPDANA